MGTGRYKVEYSPEAWGQIGVLPWEDFSSIQRTLDQLARQAVEAGASRSGTSESVASIRAASFPAAPAFVVRYRLDDAARTLTLVQLDRQHAGRESAPPPGDRESTRGRV